MLALVGRSRRQRAAAVATVAVLATLAVSAPVSPRPAAGTHAVAGTSGTSAAPAMSARPATGRLAQVVVTGRPGAGAAVAAAVAAVGGAVTRRLPIVDGVAADVPARAVADLAHRPGVASVAPDVRLTLADAGYQPASDAGSPTNLARLTGATAWWAGGWFGQGVAVAVVDSGAAPVDGLRGKLRWGPDLSPEADDRALRQTDTNGHGTFMAGLIAGRQDGAARPYVGDDRHYLGIAPEADVLSVKVADASGATTQSAVIAGIDWVVRHRDDDGIGVRVLNLSLAVPNVSGYLLSPLAAAVERAWAAGLVVVASTGNEGRTHLDLPAADPYVIAVGAVDTRGTLSTNDDAVAAFSNRGLPAAGRFPDLVAPGTHLVGLRAPGSYVDTTYGATAGVAPDLLRGTGTSESAALVSGAAALLLSRRPGLTPDQVKAALTGSARVLPGSPRPAAGNGELDLAAASARPVSDAHQHWAHPKGWTTSTADLPTGTWTEATVTATTDLAGSPDSGSGNTGTGSGSDPAPPADPAGAGSTWSGSSWSGSTWSGSSWSGSTWSGSSWSGSVWSALGWS